MPITWAAQHPMAAAPASGRLWQPMRPTAKNHAGAALRQLAARCRRKFADWRRLRRERLELRRMSERELKDIGLTRQDALMESRKPFWRR